MGSGGYKGNMREIDDTRGSLRDDAFNNIIERIVSAGGKIVTDEEFPLYNEVGLQELETGSMREIEFDLNKKEFKLTRKVQTDIILGEGNQKHLEALKTPKIELKLQLKSPNGNDWVNIDIDELM
ncbi:hypothetical protein CVV38_01280 [Candidatus Peregrinibacteria bacterium HGW-Peregrinibacteria-1]|jgi:hypothetical protein|nr:MAG: hypothetical protein CVV38_01280 [Candidatus Peregrinibacteria bacterium HGW-Peregrinibacteria-1]